MSQKTENRNSYAPHAALLGVQLMFGTFPVVGKIVLQSFPSFGVVAFRVGGAAFAFLAIQTISGGVWLKRRTDYLWMFLYAALGVIFNQLLSVTGLALTTATNSALLAVTIPVFAAVVGAIFGFDRLSFRKAAGILLAAFGVVCLINPARASFSQATTQGDLLIVVNSLCYASYIAISKKVIERNGALRSLAWLFLFGSLICVPLGAWQLRTFDFAAVSTKVWLAMAFLVLFSTIGAYYLNAWALARVEPSTVAVYIYLQPIIGFALAVLFLGEQFTARAALAGLLIFAGVLLVTRNQVLKEDVPLEHQTLH